MLSSLKYASLRNVSRLIVAALTSMGLVLTACASVIAYLLIDSERDAAVLSYSADPVGIELGEVVAALGYGGMIHDFKNYVLRGTNEHYDAVFDEAHAAKSSLDRLAKTDPEIRPLARDIAHVINEYERKTVEVKRLHGSDLTPEEIDAFVRIDDTAALLALSAIADRQQAALSEAINIAPEAGNQSKPGLLNDLRAALGYGGMIHQLKNYVLRKDEPRVVKILVELNRADENIADFLSRVNSDAEMVALKTLSQAVSGYRNAIKQAQVAAAQGLGAREIDALIKIDDAPALEALANLDATTEADLYAQTRDLDDDIRWSRFIAIVIAVATATICGGMAFGIGVVLHRSAVVPGEELSSRISSLANGDIAIKFGDLANETEIGAIAIAASSFRDALVENIDLMNAAEQSAAKHRAMAEEKTKMLAEQKLLKEEAVCSQRILEERNAELEKMANQLEHSAHHDQLTGLKNRRALQDDLDRRISSLGRSDSRTYVVQLDLDGFKLVNDTLGHPAGDVVLKRVSQVLMNMCRNGDTVARVGGDEFVVVLDVPPETAPIRVQNFAEGVISRLSEPMELEGHLYSIGASAGYAAADTGLVNRDVLISNADIALYVSKKTGKGVATAFTEEMRGEMEKRHSLISDLQRGLDADEFVPFFQPQVGFHDGRLTGFEVLGRWDHSERGIVSPADFIPLAEEVGLIEEIDTKIMMAGLDGIAALRADGWDVPKISLNCSARSLRRPDYCSDLLESLSARNLSSSDIVVEVLETSLIESSGDLAVNTVSDLARAGFEIAIDDFGTGYASLATLAALDISQLKIDRSLVVAMNSAKGKKVIEAIVALSKGLDLVVVAEGIETPTQYSALKSLGCDIAQGYKIGRPMSQIKTFEWLKTYGQSVYASKGWGPLIISG